MNSWKNAALGMLAALVMAFGGVAWASYGNRIDALETADANMHKDAILEVQRLAAVEAKVDILLQQGADEKRQNDEMIRQLNRLLRRED